MPFFSIGSVPVVVLLCGPGLVAQSSTPEDAKPGIVMETVVEPADETRATPVVNAAQTSANLLGQTNTSGGEARRNENVQVNLVDTNAAREVNMRVGTTATIVEEFRPDRDYFSAEYGGSEKAPIHVQPQTGFGIHGDLFWNHNNSVFSARSFFQVGGVKPSRRNEYGGSLGLALWKGSFFSANGFQDVNRGNVNGNVQIPLPQERTVLTIDPVARPIVEAILAAYPNAAPNRTDVAARALNTNALQSADTKNVSGQLTQKAGQRDTAVFRYSFTSQIVKAFQFVAGQNPDTTNKSHAARVTWNRVLSASTMFNASVGFDRDGSLLVAAKNAIGPVSVSGLTSLGPESDIPLDRAINRFTYSIGVQQRRSSHLMSAGFSLLRRQFNADEPDGARPVLRFRNDFGRDAITNLLMGTPSGYTQLFGNTYRAFRNWDIKAFAGDRWNVNNRVVLNFGVRWEPWTRPVEVTGLSNLPFSSDWNNVGGSAGFAIRAPRGTIHGAFGAMFGQLYPATYGQDRLNPPYVARIQVVVPDLANPFGGINPNEFLGKTRATWYRLAPDLATPYSYQYNLGWEAGLAQGWRLQLGYVGSRSHKLFQTLEHNRAVPVEGIAHNTSTVNLRRPDATALNRYYTHNGSRAYYDAARVSLMAPRWRGMNLNLSYWFSKSIDLGSDYNSTASGGDSDSQTETNVHQDLKGLSNFDQPHALLLQGTYSTAGYPRTRLSGLYRNWDVSGVFLLKSGTPFTVETGADGPGFGNSDGSGSDRPMLVDPSAVVQSVGDPDTSMQALPRSAFRYIHAPEETFGNLGRNTFRKGKIANLNASLSRTWAVAREWRLTLRAEAINLANTPQFAQPGRQLSTPNFGQITNTLNDGRTFRFLLRLGF